jgi:signal transduction histidine kinase
LVPPSIGISSLKEVIQDLLEPIRLGTAIDVGYEITDVDNNMLTTEQQLNVYRIIQEHLNNILKHSKATNVFIGIKNQNNQVEINIKDNGQGFDVTIRRKGIGFKNIQSRAELLNGKMNVASKPGSGCLLTVNFPLKGSACLVK